MKVRVVATAWLLGLAAVTVAGEGADTFEKDTKGLAPIEMERVEADRRHERLLFAYSTTTSIKRLATTTITAISTCLSTLAGAPACQGRKKKSLIISLENLKNFSEDLAVDLMPSQAVVEEVDQPASRVLSGREGRKFTIWSSYISTLTLTSTSYLTGTTITATALCVAPGVSQGCFGK